MHEGGDMAKRHTENVRLFQFRAKSCLAANGMIVSRDRFVGRTAKAANDTSEDF